MIRRDLGGKGIDTLPPSPKFWSLRVTSLPCGLVATRFKFLYSSLFFSFFFYNIQEILQLENMITVAPRPHLTREAQRPIFQG